MNGQAERSIHLIAGRETLFAQVLLGTMRREFRSTRKKVKHRLDTGGQQFIAKQDLNPGAAESQRDGQRTLDNSSRNEPARACSDQDSWTVVAARHRPGP